MSKPEIRSIEALVGKLFGAGLGLTRSIRLERSPKRETLGGQDSMFADVLNIALSGTFNHTYRVDPSITNRAINLKLLSGDGVATSGLIRPTHTYVANPHANPLKAGVDVAAPHAITAAQYKALADFAVFPYLHRAYGKNILQIKLKGGLTEWPPTNPIVYTSLEAHNLIDVDTDYLPGPSGRRSDKYPDMGYVCKITQRGINSLNLYASENKQPDWPALVLAAPALIAEKQALEDKRTAKGTRLNGAVLHYELEPEWRLVFYSDDGDLTVGQPLSIPGVVTDAEANVMALLWTQAAAILSDEDKRAAVLEAIRQNKLNAARNRGGVSRADQLTHALGESDANE